MPPSFRAFPLVVHAYSRTIVDHDTTVDIPQCPATPLHDLCPVQFLVSRYQLWSIGNLVELFQVERLLRRRLCFEIRIMRFQERLQLRDLQ